MQLLNVSVYYSICTVCCILYIQVENCDVFIDSDSDQLNFYIVCVDVVGYVQVSECYVLLNVNEFSSS